MAWRGGLEKDAILVEAGLKKKRETLIHYSRVPLTQVNSVPSDEQPNGDKPMGLWVSVENDWEIWCEGADFSLKNLAYAHRIVLRANANILRLSSAQQIDAFTAEYCSAQRVRNWFVEWSRVAERFDGIIIAPYIYTRGGAGWHYSWDCASGCIWNASAVEQIVPLTPVKRGTACSETTSEKH